MYTIDYYDVLQIGRNAKANEIKAAFRRLSREALVQGREDELGLLEEADRVLSDPREKVAYDSFWDATFAPAPEPTFLLRPEMLNFGQVTQNAPAVMRVSVSHVSGEVEGKTVGITGPDWARGSLSATPIDVFPLEIIVSIDTSVAGGQYSGRMEFSVGATIYYIAVSVEIVAPVVEAAAAAAPAAGVTAPATVPENVKQPWWLLSTLSSRIFFVSMNIAAVIMILISTPWASCQLLCLAPVVIIDIALVLSRLRNARNQAVTFSRRSWIFALLLLLAAVVVGFFLIVNTTNNVVEQAGISQVAENETDYCDLAEELSTFDSSTNQTTVAASNKWPAGNWVLITFEVNYTTVGFAIGPGQSHVFDGPVRVLMMEAIQVGWPSGEQLVNCSRQIYPPPSE